MAKELKVKFASSVKESNLTSGLDISKKPKKGRESGINVARMLKER